LLLAGVRHACTLHILVMEVVLEHDDKNYRLLDGRPVLNPLEVSDTAHFEEVAALPYPTVLRFASAFFTKVFGLNIPVSCSWVYNNQQGHLEATGTHIEFQPSLVPTIVATVKY
jgi:hypothetical protein